MLPQTILHMALSTGLLDVGSAGGGFRGFYLPGFRLARVPAGQGSGWPGFRLARVPAGPGSGCRPLVGMKELLATPQTYMFNGEASETGISPCCSKN